MAMRVNVKRIPTEVMYLVVIDRMLKKYRELIIEVPNERFEAMVRKEVMNYIVDGDEPPDEIQTAIMNVADDVMSGREVSMRAGDYISLMNYARKNEMI